MESDNGYRIRIDHGDVRINNGKHEFVIDTYYRKVEIDRIALYYLNSDKAVETLNELLNREIAPEEMNYLRGVSLLDYRRHGKWLERFKDRPIGKLKRAVLLSYILDGYDYGRKKQWLVENGYSEGELKARKIAHELLEENEEGSGFTLHTRVPAHVPVLLRAVRELRLPEHIQDRLLWSINLGMT